MDGCAYVFVLPGWKMTKDRYVFILLACLSCREANTDRCRQCGTCRSKRTAADILKVSLTCIAIAEVRCT